MNETFHSLEVSSVTTSAPHYPWVGPRAEYGNRQGRLHTLAQAPRPARKSYYPLLLSRGAWLPGPLNRLYTEHRPSSPPWTVAVQDRRSPGLAGRGHGNLAERMTSIGPDAYVPRYMLSLAP